MSEKRYIVTENQILKGVRTALEIRIQEQSIVECIMDDIENILDFDCFEEYKESDEG